jgi:alkaline phosphatase D
MLPQPYGVRYEVAHDEGFRRIVRRGAVEAVPDAAHSVHVELSGLEPGREYFYRFKVAREISPVGRTCTAPPAAAAVERLRFAFVSCQNYPAGYFNAYADVATQDLDLVVHLGDYIYEGPAAELRAHEPRAEIFTLAEYRTRHGQYKTDLDLQAAHAAHPWLVTWDDHEVDNNYADEEADPDAPPEEFLARPGGGVPGVLGAHAAAPLEPDRTMLGAEQRAWLFEQLATTEARWNVLAQQTALAPFDREPAPDARSFGAGDNWDGYVAERQQVLDWIVAHETRNPVVITGDSHANWIRNVPPNFTDFDAPPVATELMGTSITSGGDPAAPSTTGLEAAALARADQRRVATVAAAVLKHGVDDPQDAEHGDEDGDPEHVQRRERAERGEEREQGDDGEGQDPEGLAHGLPHARHGGHLLRLESSSCRS